MKFERDHLVHTNTMPMGVLSMYVAEPRYQAEDLIGRDVLIHAESALGSARLLDGLRATVLMIHPVITTWVKIYVHPNDRTKEEYWSIDVNRLIVMESVEAAGAN